MKWSYCSPASFKIPLLLFGDVLKKEYKGKQIKTIGSQVDIPATVLAQLDLPYNKFEWSKNLLNTNPNEFAFYSWYDGYGWIRPSGHFAYENRFAKFLHLTTDSSKTDDQLIKEGRSYLQYTFDQYLSY